MKLLVTGGAGYIGGVVVRRLLDAGHDVTVYDDLSTGHADAIDARATAIKGSVHDIAGVLRPGAGFDGVLHLAARIAAGESVERPELYWDTNVRGSLAVLDAMRSARVRRLVFSSTAAVYGDPDTVPIPEDARTAPTNPYGATKLAVDMAIAAECVAHGLAAVSLRYFNVAGAVDDLGERHSPETHLIPLALQVAAGERAELTVYGEDYPTPDGTCVRDYIHVSDLADAHLLALDGMTDTGAGAGAHRVYNLGNGAGFSVREVVEVVRRVTGRPVPTASRPRREGDPAVLVASSARARAELGWAPRYPALVDIVADAWRFHGAGAGRR